MNWEPIKVFPGCYGVHTAKMTRQQWVEARDMAGVYGIGGSEIGLLLPGADLRFNSPIRMFYRRIGLWESAYSDNKYAFMGRFMEQQIIHLWQHWDGNWQNTMDAVDAGKRSRKSQHCNYIIKNPEYPFLFANIDNRIIQSPDAPKKRGILECKTISGHASDRYETGIPPKYVSQMQQYMLVTNTDYAELAVLKDGVDFEVYPLYANETIQNAIINAADEFMQRVTSARHELDKMIGATFEEKLQAVQEFEPEVEEGTDEYQFLSEKAKMREASNMVEADSEILEWYATHQELKDKAKDDESTMQMLKNKIRQRMIADNVYQYKIEGKTIVTNGQRFMIR